MTKVEVVADFQVPKGIPFTADDWKALGDIVGLELTAGIDAQVDVTGAPYPPLKPNTVASKTEAGYSEPNKRLVATGNLRRNYVKTVLANGVQLALGPTRIEIGSYQQRGIKPHVIRAKKGKLLSFVTTGGRTYAKRVKHPGTQPVPFFGISLKCSERILRFADSVLTRHLEAGEQGGTKT